MEENLSSTGKTVNTDKVSRVEVIDQNGRSYVNMEVKNLELNFQDQERTLKLFIT